MKPKEKKSARAKKDADDITDETDEPRLALDSFAMHAALGIYTMNPHTPENEDN